MDTPSRDEAVARLKQYQEQDLKELRQQLENLNREIETTEVNVANYNNLLSAARGVVGMRGGVVDYASSEKRKRKSYRTKQRLWTKRDASTVFHQPQPLPPPTHFLAPCGMIYTAFQKRFEAPRQSFTGSTARATIVLTRAPNDDEDSWKRSGLFAGLKPGKRLWIIYWFDRNASHWRQLVRPPRAKGGFRVGLFATRSPNRPTPIGLSLSAVESFDESLRQIHVSGVDVLDETPLIALKEYDELREAFLHTQSGWLDDHDRLQPLYYDPVIGESNLSSYSLQFDPKVRERIEFVNERSAVDIQSLIRESLTRIPNNVTLDQSGVVRQRTGSLPVGSYRVNYRIEPTMNMIFVTGVVSGMRRDVCEAEAASDPEARLHLRFQTSYQD
ncbi:tRNA-methyltransferase O [Gracilaria domingensis]|nr:tRNA-methyltransferase O [Gracilaria domingensis]